MQWETDAREQMAQAMAALARKRVAAAPDNPAGWLMLGHALIALGDFHDAASSLGEAAVKFPDSADVHRTLAEAFMAQDKRREALAQAEAAVALAPGDARARHIRAGLLASLGRLDGDAQDVASGLSSDPRILQSQVGAAGPQAGLALCNAQLVVNPGHTNAKYLKALSLASLRRADDARKLMDLDRLIDISELPAPPLFEDTQSFRQALACEITANPTLVRDPRNKATQDGLQTTRLRQPGASATEALLAQIMHAVDCYENRLLVSGDDFALGRPAKARLVSWAVVYGGQGRQKSHLHPGGWLSGVYYVSAPRPHGENAFRGALIMGELENETLGFAPPWGTRAIEPVPGRLVLFPSFVPHATEPTGVEGARISVAFDVAPVIETDR